MTEPKYKIGQKVKFTEDHERMTGAVLNFTYGSEQGYVYTVASRYYDTELHDMVEGHIICREDELEDMSSYDGSTTPEKPAKTVKVGDKVAKQ